MRSTIDNRNEVTYNDLTTFLHSKKALAIVKKEFGLVSSDFDVLAAAHIVATQFTGFFRASQLAKRLTTHPNNIYPVIKKLYSHRMIEIVWPADTLKKSAAGYCLTHKGSEVVDRFTGVMLKLKQGK